MDYKKLKDRVIIFVMLTINIFILPINVNAQIVKDKNSYESSTLSIKIQEINNPTLKMWIAHIKVKNPELQMKAAFGSGRFGGKRQTVTKMAKNNNAILAINGSAFSYKTNKSFSIVVRDGKIYQDRKDIVLCIKKDGELFIPDTPKTAKELLQEGAYNTFWFGPVLVKNGKNVVSGKYPSYINASSPYPRTAIGMINKGEYVVIVADGKRPKYSKGITCKNLADEFIKRGCSIAYNLDGGGSSTMYFNGRIMNVPSDISSDKKTTVERPIADILYFADQK